MTNQSSLRKAVVAAVDGLYQQFVECTFWPNSQAIGGLLNTRLLVAV